MAVKIRLARKGRKKKAYYHIVVADSRAPRDGRFIEKLGIYNPITDPATIEIDFDKALGWLQKGAQPTDTCRAILSYRGIMMKKHLLEGVKKGAFNEEEAENRFQAWMKEKDAKIEQKMAGIEKTEEQLKTSRLEAEKKINEARAADLARKRSEIAAAEAAAKTAAAEPAAEVEEVTETADEVIAEVAPEVENVTDEVAEESTEAVEEVSEATEEVVEATTEEAAPVEKEVTEEAAPSEEAEAEETESKE
jgi:small subunit ribosomal protein S16